MDLTTDTMMIGAGVAGLAVAGALARSGVETVILERRRGIGEETSSRNSEVIHTGIYYPPGLLRAETLASGKERLSEFLSAHRVTHRRCGKLVVARDAARQDALDGPVESGSLMVRAKHHLLNGPGLPGSWQSGP